ncbi:MAG: S4 domain-containing protein [Candidatus Micrarchaeia archaeon]
MSRKGNSRHIKRLAASKFEGLERKIAKYAMKPKPGRHSLELSVPLASLIRYKLQYAATDKEAVKAIKLKGVEINGKIAKSPKQPVGYGDIIRIVPTGEYFAIGVGGRGALSLEKVSADTKRVAKIVGKYVAKGNTLMVRLHDGTVLQVPKGMEIATNDSVLLAKGKIESVLKLEQGAQCSVYKGRHAGEKGTIKSITKGNTMEGARVEIDTQNGVVQTLLDNVIVTGGVSNA